LPIELQALGYGQSRNPQPDTQKPQIRNAKLKTIVMAAYKKSVEVRWSDLDPNFHLRHSAYYDFGAYCRICFLTDHGATTALMLQHKIGPILFREECVFRREIVFGDRVEINLRLKKSTRDNSRWTMIHEILKNGDTLAAIITIDGAWIDTEKRKLTAPPSFVLSAFDDVERTSDFEWIEKQV
jgi:acyl-CoA thioester hydrolase